MIRSLFLLGFLASTANAAIIRTENGRTPAVVVANPAAYLRVEQTKGANTTVEILADDTPSIWMSSGGPASIYYVQRTTPRMWLWAKDYDAATQTHLSTTHELDLTPFAEVATLTLDIGLATQMGALVCREYVVNGEAFTYPVPVPEPRGAALAAVACAVLCYHARLKSCT